MFDSLSLITRQAQWQRQRAGLSWAEKVHQAERLRDSLLELRRMRIKKFQTLVKPPASLEARRNSE